MLTMISKKNDLKMLISKGNAIKLITDKFPVLSQEIKNEQGNIYMQVAALTRYTQKTIDNRDEIMFLQICELFQQLFSIASPPIKNALYVSFLEQLNFQDSNRANRQWAYQKMPGMMKDAYHAISSYNTQLSDSVAKANNTSL